MQGLAAVDEAQIWLLFLSKTKARNDDAIAWLRELVGAGECCGDVSENTAPQPSLIPGHRGSWIGGRGIVQIRTVEEIGELDAKVEAHPFLESPRAPEI